MRSPARSLAGNLMWTRTGAVWAVWRLQALPYGYRPDKDKAEVRGLHMALIRALPGESMLLSVCAGLDPAAVVERMIVGVDLENAPDWAAECEATLDTLDAIGIGQRVHWLAVPLTDFNGRDRAMEPWRAATAELRDTLGLPRPGIPEKEVTRRLGQARKIAEGIPTAFHPTPATAAQLVWLNLHAQNRGLFADYGLPEQPTDLATELLTPRSGSALSEPLLDEGGQTDVDRKNRKNWNPFDHRYLKVMQPHSVTETGTSYQCLMVLSDVPAEGMTFPGSEFLGRIDECGLEVDWAMRLTVRSSDQVAKTNRRALINLNEQFDQREGELSHGLNALERAANDLAEYSKILDTDKLEVEAQATIVFCTAAPEAEQAVEQSRRLADYLGAAGYKLQAPLGYQEDLWWSMVIGAAPNRAVREYAQITTSRALSATVPLASTDLGDVKGSLIGLNISTGRLGAVLHDIAGASLRDVSGSMGIAGELGAGKALALDTPVPTPSGWTTMGNLAPGDRVFDATGAPTVVTAVSPVMHQRDCYDVVFSDGSVITADAEHLWTTIPRRVRDRQAKLNHKRRARGHAPVDLLEVTQQLTGPGWHSSGTVSTTGQLRATLHSGNQLNHAIPAAGALDLPDLDLPVAPYVLGVWLGDGSSRGAQVTSADPEILAHVELEGYVVRKLTAKYLYAVALPHEEDDRYDAETRPCAWCKNPTWCWYEARTYCSRTCSIAAHRAGVAPLPARQCNRCGKTMSTGSLGRRCAPCRGSSTLGGRLRGLDVLQNKHIPPSYLRASVTQRRALLAGLLDTDGTVAPSGAIEFSNTNERLARGVHELACSLGYRAAIREGRALLEGRDCGPKWTVAFTTVGTDQVFWLQRKRRTHLERTSNASLARNRYRYVVDVRPATSVPVRCIQVAAESRLFLAGRAMIPTHNSVLQKKLAGDVVDRGGQIVVPDRTKMGEWAHWAGSVTEATIVDVADPTISLDPLRLFGPVVGSRITQSFLTPLLDIAPTSDRGVLLSEVLDPDYLTKHQLVGLGDVLAHLGTSCDLDGAKDLAKLMNVFARRDFGRVVFDNSLPPLNPSSPAVIIRTHTLELPNKTELETAHLFAQMRLEKVFGRAMYALIAGVARQICFADLDRLGLFVVDEAHHLTSSPEGEREIIDFVRDGRKHTAAVILGSHDPETDFGSPTLRGLVPTRILMRHRDKTLAKRGLAWLDMDPEDEDLVEMLIADTSPVGPNGVEEHRRGEAFVRDSSGNIGRIKVLAPSLPSRNAAVRSSPGQKPVDVSSDTTGLTWGPLMISRPVREALERWWDRHPRLRKVFVVFILSPALVVVTSPVAYADNTKTTAPSSLTWMDIKDSHGISVWRYELSLDRGGVTNPGKLVWSVLTEWMWQFYRAFVAIAIWIIDWALSFSWLNTVADPIMGLGQNLTLIVQRFGLAPALLTITALVAVVWMMRGRWVTGIFELFLSLIIASLSVGVLANPVGLVAGDDGLLIGSRDFGLAISSGLIHDGNTDGSPEEMRADITATLADTFIRQPTQLINFGEVVDGGKCEETYDEVLKDGPYGDDSDIRDAMDGCEDRLGETAEHPNAGMAMSAGVLYPAAFIVLLFAVILAGTVLVASVQALYRGLKLIVDLALAMLPGAARGGLWMSVADLVMSLVTVVFSCVFLTGFLLLIQSVFADGGTARIQTFFIVDMLLVVGIIVFWRGRGRLKEASERLAQALSKRPGGGGPSSLPARSKFSPHEAYYKGRMALGAAKIASTGAMTLSSGGLALAAGAGRAAASAGRTATRPVTDSASRISWAGGIGRSETQSAASSPSAPAELTSAQRVLDRVGAATAPSSRGQLARVGAAVMTAPGNPGVPGGSGGPNGSGGPDRLAGGRAAGLLVTEARRAALSQRMRPAAELASPAAAAAGSESGTSPPATATARALTRPGLTPGSRSSYERVETPDAVVLVPQSPASNAQASTGQPGSHDDSAAAARLRARLEQRRVIALPRSSRVQQT